MSDISKLPKWAQDLLERKDMEIAQLQHDKAVLSKNVEVANPVGHVLLTGYLDGAPLPLDRHFRATIESGPSAGLEVSLSAEGLEVRSVHDWVSALPRAANVMLMLAVKP